jgi:uncharacterized protein YqkB
MEVVISKKMKIYLETETLREIESNLSPPFYFQKHNVIFVQDFYINRYNDGL